MRGGLLVSVRSLKQVEHMDTNPLIYSQQLIVMAQYLYRLHSSPALAAVKPTFSHWARWRDGGDSGSGVLVN